MTLRTLRVPGAPTGHGSCLSGRVVATSGTFPEQARDGDKVTWEMDRAASAGSVHRGDRAQEGEVSQPVARQE